MNLVITIFLPEKENIYEQILNSYGSSIATLDARGTAIQNMLDLLGIKSKERRAGFAIMDNEATINYLNGAKQNLYIGIPGQGLVMGIPLKSVGGQKAMSLLKIKKEKPNLDYKYELIVAVCQEGYTSLVMQAAREGGATGGTIIHGKGTGNPELEQFHHVSIGSEKELIFIVARSDKKQTIMEDIVKKAGLETEAKTIVFSLPVSAIAGFGLGDGFA